VNEEIILRGVIEVLRQGETLLDALDDVAYATRVPGAFNASIGGHYRHCLDHFQSLLDALDGDEVNYDNRKRDPRIENEREFALMETRRVFRGCDSIPREWLRRVIQVRSKVNYGDDAAPAMPSTLGREIMYAVAHAIHHYALIAVMCGMLGVCLPKDFGVAPSTVKYDKEAGRRARYPNERTGTARLLAS
jgi:uncharacterized damage-inducible protein DinB